MQKPNLSLKKAAGLQQVLETSNIRVTTVTGREIEALIKNTVISHLSLHTQQNVLDIILYNYKGSVFLLFFFCIHFFLVNIGFSLGFLYLQVSETVNCKENTEQSYCTR